METVSREIKTVAHPVKIRELGVRSLRKLSPRFMEVILSGPDLSDFVSLSPDDHIKAFFPREGAGPDFGRPLLGEGGLRFEEGKPAPVMRDYTPRWYRNGELCLEFFLHEGGAGANWARKAQVGSKLLIAGPRGSRVVPYAFDWYLMIGDESALPSFRRRLEEMPADTKGHLILEIGDSSDRIPLSPPREVRVHWLERGGAKPGDPSRLQSLLGELAFPEGDYFAWVSGEGAAVKSAAEFLLETKGAHREWMKVTSYWSAKGPSEK